jgi:hypothetical protein
MNKTQGESQANSGNDRRFKPGTNSRSIKNARVEAKAEMLRKVFFADGGMGIMDAMRLKLAAQHYVTAETARDPNTSVRSVNAAERLLALIKRPAEPEPAPPSIDQILRGEG